MGHPLIVLASTSRYRRELFERLQLPFKVEAPHVDEAVLPRESPRETALRLAREKAVTVAARFDAAVIIGSDQTVDLNGVTLGKPLTHIAALTQLRAMQGQTAIFHSALAVIGPGAAVQLDSISTRVTFRTLSGSQLETYLHADRPYDCAGSAKIESLGIALVERVESDDPTALIGLPLIRLTSMLAVAGIEVLGR
ncbi:MAG: septum formation protein Maf [Burkholderiaceae bacterium]|nr:septum formation protein Maf [Burkholderiaceae bacterium]